MASITRFYALILSTVLLLSGVPGFFPNVGSFQVLVTFFALTLVHSVVHVAVGLLGLLITALASDDSVRIYTIGIALLYGALAIVGLIGVNFAPILYFNSADNWLHGSIFVLSLGVFLAGVAEERVRQQRARVNEGLSSSHWAIPSGPARAAAFPSSQESWQADANTSDATQEPWYRQPRHEQPAPIPWGQATWQQNQPQQNQRHQQDQPSPYPQPQSQPLYSQQPPDQLWEPSRDPWTREQRQAPYQPPSQPAGSPSRGQSSNPWSQNPSRPDPGQWPSSPWPQSQPPQGSSPWSPWPQDSQPQDGQPSQAREQWPLDEWPSVRDSRPLK
jgi:Domain of unknown function (DUF4383)